MVDRPNEVSDSFEENVRRGEKARTKLEELVEQVTDENIHEPVDWGPPVGNEVW